MLMLDIDIMHLMLGQIRLDDRNNCKKYRTSIGHRITAKHN